MNWRDMKEFCNSIGEKQLDNKVVLLQENSTINKIEAMQLSDDHYIDPERREEGCFPLDEAGMTLEEAKKKKYPKVYNEGDPILWEKF